MIYNFFRIIRTKTSEAYGILDKNDDVIGRFDLHYADDGRIDALIVVQKDMSEDEQLKLVQKIDIDLVENAELNDDNFNITFFNATDARMYGKEKN